MPAGCCAFKRSRHVNARARADRIRRRPAVRPGQLAGRVNGRREVGGLRHVAAGTPTRGFPIGRAVPGFMTLAGLASRCVLGGGGRGAARGVDRPGPRRKRRGVRCVLGVEGCGWDLDAGRRCSRARIGGLPGSAPLQDGALLKGTEARQAPAIVTRMGRDPGGGSGRRRRLERGPPSAAAPRNSVPAGAGHPEAA